MWVDMEVELKDGHDGLKWGRRGGLVLVGTMDDLSEIPICESNSLIITPTYAANI